VFPGLNIRRIYSIFVKKFFLIQSQFKVFEYLAVRTSIVVKRLSQYPKIKGLGPATGTWREKIARNKQIFVYIIKKLTTVPRVAKSWGLYYINFTAVIVAVS
jgi:hypothetical protein